MDKEGERTKERGMKAVCGGGELLQLRDGML
jgi:hypothetical protein